MSNKANLAIIFAIAFLSLEVMPGCERLKKYNEQELVQRAQDFQGKGDLKAAVIELKNALQKNQNNAEARLLLGQIYVEAGDGNSAEHELLKAGQLGLNPESTKVYMGQALLLQGLFSRVLQEIQPTDKTSQSNLSKILQIHGDAYLGLGKIKEACTSYTGSKEKDSTHVPTYWGLAKCFAVQHDFEQAKSQLDVALKLNNQNAETWVLVGDLESLRNNRRAAEAAYLSAKKVDSKNIGAYLGHALLYIKVHELDKADKELQDARKVARDNLMVRYMQAFVAFQQKKYTEARDELQAVLRAMPDHMPSILLSGEVAFTLGTYEIAEAALNKFLAQSPDNVFARKLLAATFLKTGQAERALNALKPAISEETQDPQLLALAGEIQLAKKEYVKATEFLEKAATIDPKNVAVRTGFGVSLLAKGDSERAVMEIESAAALDPTQYKADTLLVLTHLGNKEYDKALAAINALEKKQPNTALVHNLRGGAYLGKRDFSLARKSFEQALAIDPAFIQAARNLSQLDMQDKKPEAARMRFENVLAKDKNSVEAMLALADFAAASKKEKEYVEWLDKAAKVAPKELEPKAKLIAYYLDKKENQKALELARETKAANPNNVHVWGLLGRTQLISGEKENAVVSFTKATQLAPDAPRAYLDLGVALVAAGRGADAQAIFSKALAMNADYFDARRALINLELQQGKGADALKLAEEQTRRQPKSPAGPVFEGDAYMVLKQYPKAVKAYERAFTQAKDGGFIIKIHQAMRLAGDESGADARVVGWLKGQPNDLATRIYLADSLAARKRFKTAIEHYELALQKSSNNPLILNNLAVAYSEIKDSRALATVERASKLDPVNPAIKDTLGWILLGQGQAARAVELLKQATDAVQNSAEIRYHYALALAKMGDKTKAKQELDKAFKLDNQFPSKSEAEALRKQL